MATSIGYDTSSSGYLQISFSFKPEERRKKSLNELRMLMEELVSTENQENIKEVETKIATIFTNPDMADVLERVIKATKDKQIISLFAVYRKSNNDVLLCRVVNLLIRSLRKKYQDMTVRPEHIEGAKALANSLKKVYSDPANRSTMRRLQKSYEQKPKVATKYNPIIAKLAQQRSESLNKLLNRTLSGRATLEDIEEFIRIEREELQVFVNGGRELNELPPLAI